MARQRTDIQISTSGGSQTQREFADVGATSSAAFNRMQRDALQANTGLTHLDQRMQRMRTSVGAFRGDITSLSSVLTRWSGLLIGAAGVLGGSFLAQAIKTTAEIGKFSARLGISGEALQELRHIARAAQIDFDAVADGIKELQLRADEFAVTGKGSAAEAFQRLGLSPDEVKTRLKDPVRFLEELITALRGVGQAAQLRITDELFGGQGGEQMVQLTKLATGELGRLRQEARRLGLVLSDDMVQQSVRANAQLEQMQQILSTQLTRAVVSLAPHIISLGESVARITTALVGGNDAMQDLTANEQAVVDTLTVIGATARATGDAISWFTSTMQRGAAFAALLPLQSRITDLQTVVKGLDRIPAGQRTEAQQAQLENTLARLNTLYAEMARLIDEIEGKPPLEVLPPATVTSTREGLDGVNGLLDGTIEKAQKLAGIRPLKDLEADIRILQAALRSAKLPGEIAAIQKAIAALETDVLRAKLGPAFDRAIEQAKELEASMTAAFEGSAEQARKFADEDLQRFIQQQDDFAKGWRTLQDDTLKAQTEATERALDDQHRAWERFARQTEDVVATLLFAQLEDGFDGTLKTMKRLFENFLVETSAAAITNQIIIPGAQQAAGFLGDLVGARPGVALPTSGQSAQGTLGGQLSNLGSIGGTSMSNLLTFQVGGRPVTVQGEGVSEDILIGTTGGTTIDAGAAPGAIFGGIQTGEFVSQGIGSISPSLGGVGFNRGSFNNMRLGGVTGGAVAGMQMTGGSPWGAMIGAAIGEMVATAMFFTGEGKPHAAAILTSPTDEGFQPPGSRRGPFGHVGLLDALTQNTGAALTADITQLILTIDQAVSDRLTIAQRELATTALQDVGVSQRLKFYNFDNEAAIFVQERLSTILDAIAPEPIAARVLGRIQPTEENLTALTTAFDQAVAVIQAIDAFTTDENLSEAELSIRAIEDAFADLTLQADMLGLATDTLTAARERELTQLTTDFARGVQQQILELTDPFQAAATELQALQEERLRNALVLGADLNEVERLTFLERLALAEQFGQDLGAVADFLHGRLTVDVPGGVSGFATIDGTIPPGGLDTAALQRELDSVADFLTALKFGPTSALSTTQQLGAAERLFRQEVGAFGSGAGSAGDLLGAAQTLLDVSREAFASSSGFFERQRFVERTLQNLLQDQAGQTAPAPVQIANTAPIQITSLPMEQGLDNLGKSLGDVQREIQSLGAQVAQLIAVSEKSALSMLRVLQKPA
jgi:hypothetical protein